jgi:hypothetical protein
MTVMAIDTLQFSRRMQNAGLSQNIAEELAEAIKDSTSISTENIATKQDLQEVKRDIEITNKDLKAAVINLRHEIKTSESSLRQEIKTVESSLRQEIKTVESSLRQEIKMSEQRITIRIGAMVTIAIAVVTWLNNAIH